MARPTQGIGDVAVKISASVYHTYNILRMRDPEKFPNFAKFAEFVCEQAVPTELNAGRKAVETLLDAVESN